MIYNKMHMKAYETSVPITNVINVAILKNTSQD